MGSRERREREKLEIREKILEAARALFVERGVDATTMREIAKRIDYTPTAIYHHFQDKEAVIYELCRRDFTELAQLFMRIGRIEDPIERLRRIGHAYCEFGLRFPSHYRFMFMTPSRSVTPEHVGISHEDPNESSYAFLRETVSQAIAEDRLRPEYRDADLVAQVLWAGVHGIVSLRITMEDPGWINWREAHATTAVIIDALIRGVTCTDDHR